MDISEKIRVLRTKKGLSQEELAENVGVSRQSVSKWESGQAVPELNRIVQLCDFFDISADQLIKPELGIDDEPQYNHNNRQYSFDPLNNKVYFMEGYIRGKKILFAFCWVSLFLLSTSILAATITNSDDSNSQILPTNLILLISNIGIIVGLIITLLNKSRLKSFFPLELISEEMKRENREKITGTKYFKIGCILLFLPTLLTVISIIVLNIIIPKFIIGDDFSYEILGFTPTVVKNSLSMVLLVAFAYMLVGIIILISNNIKSRQ